MDFAFSTIVDKGVDKFVRNKRFPLKLFHNPVRRKLFPKQHNGFYGPIPSQFSCLILLDRT